MHLETDVRLYINNIVGNLPASEERLQQYWQSTNEGQKSCHHCYYARGDAQQDSWWSPRNDKMYCQGTAVCMVAGSDQTHKTESGKLWYVQRKCRTHQNHCWWRHYLLDHDSALQQIFFSGRCTWWLLTTTQHGWHHSLEKNKWGVSSKRKRTLVWLRCDVHPDTFYF